MKTYVQVVVSSIPRYRGAVCTIHLYIGAVFATRLRAVTHPPAVASRRLSMTIADDYISHERIV